MLQLTLLDLPNLSSADMRIATSATCQWQLHVNSKHRLILVTSACSTDQHERQIGVLAIRELITVKVPPFVPGAWL